MKLRRCIGVLCLVAFVIGCGDGDAPQPSAGSSLPLEAAVRTYTEAFLGGDADAAYDLLSERCRGELARNDFTAIVAQASAQYGDAEITSYEDDVRGNVATATYELSDPTLNQVEERWLLEGGNWRNDDC